MPKNSNQKKKILCLMEIFMERTDSEHPFTVPMLLKALTEYHITAERKSVYDDINTLREFGMEISTEGGNGRGYFLAKRKIEQHEVETLIDAVNCASFLSERKTGLLVRKLHRLVSRHQARTLQSQTEGRSLPKEQDETVCENLLLLHRQSARKKGYNFIIGNIRCVLETEPPSFNSVKKGGVIFMPFRLLWIGKENIVG